MTAPVYIVAAEACVCDHGTTPTIIFTGMTTVTTVGCGTSYCRGMASTTGNGWVHHTSAYDIFLRMGPRAAPLTCTHAL